MVAILTKMWAKGRNVKGGAYLGSLVFNRRPSPEYTVGTYVPMPGRFVYFARTPRMNFRPPLSQTGSRSGHPFHS